MSRLAQAGESSRTQSPACAQALAQKATAASRSGSALDRHAARATACSMRSASRPIRATARACRRVTGASGEKSWPCRHRRRWHHRAVQPASAPVAPTLVPLGVVVEAHAVGALGDHSTWCGRPLNCLQSRGSAPAAGTPTLAQRPSRGERVGGVVRPASGSSASGEQTLTAAPARRGSDQPDRSRRLAGAEAEADRAQAGQRHGEPPRIILGASTCTPSPWKIAALVAAYWPGRSA